MRSRVIAVVLAVGLLLSACGGGSAEAPTPIRPPTGTPRSTPAPLPPADPVEVQGSPTIAEIRQRGKLLVGLRSDAPEFVQRSRGDYSGFDVKIARILAEGLGLDPKTDVAFRWLPATLRVDAVLGGSVDLQLAGFAPTSGLATVGPYVISGEPGAAREHFIGVVPGDSAMREKLREILAHAVADGRLKRAVESTLSEAGVPARVPDLPR